MSATQPASSRAAKRGIAFWRGKREPASRRVAEQTATMAQHDSRFRHDAARFRSDEREPRSAGAIDSTCFVLPSQHAAELLDWLQGPGGRTGILTVPMLTEMHGDLCAERCWEIASWRAVGRELRRLLGGKKHWAYVRGKRCVVYIVPPRATRRSSGDSEERGSSRRAA